jgi:ABC-type uncharacterized transport system ATPase subunit
MAEKIKSISNATILMASYDDEIHRICDRLIEVNQGEIKFDGNYSEYQKRKQC